MRKLSLALVLVAASVAGAAEPSRSPFERFLHSIGAFFEKVTHHEKPTATVGLVGALSREKIAKRQEQREEAVDPPPPPPPPPPPAPPAPPPPPPADTALAWARSADPGAYWSYCLAFCYDAYAKTGHPIPEMDSDHAGWARAAFDNFWGEGRVHVGGNPPEGAIVFYDFTAYYPAYGWRNYGHVVISNGDGTAVSSPQGPSASNPGPIVTNYPIENSPYGNPIGWVDPPK